MLVAFRTVLPGVGSPEGGEFELAEFDAGLPGTLAKAEVFRVGTAGVVFALVSLGVGRAEDVTARRGVVAPVVGMPEAAEPGRDASLALAVSGRGLRSLGLGNAGRGPVGGGLGGLDEVLCGSAEVMVAVDMEPNHQREMRLPVPCFLLFLAAARLR